MRLKDPNETRNCVANMEWRTKQKIEIYWISGNFSQETLFSVGYIPSNICRNCIKSRWWERSKSVVWDLFSGILAERLNSVEIAHDLEWKKKTACCSDQVPTGMSRQCAKCRQYFARRNLNICRIWMKSGRSERSISVVSDVFYGVFVRNFADSDFWFDLLK